MELVGWGGREDMGRAAAGESVVRTDCMKRASSGLHYPKAHPTQPRTYKIAFLRFCTASRLLAPQSREVCSPELCTARRELQSPERSVLGGSSSRPAAV